MERRLKRAIVLAFMVSLLNTITIPVQAVALANPSDSLYSSQKYLKTIGVPQAWGTVNQNSDLTIAIVDTGVDLTHPDLIGNLVPGYNVIEPEQSVQDLNGHGTNVAGVIGAIGNNKLGVSGILWRTKLMPIKALDSTGHGEEIHLAEGIRYAVDHKAKIIVLSLGVVNYSTLLKEAILYAERNNVLVVAAAGNEGKEIKYPAAFPTVVSVGGIDPTLKLNTKSNRGSEMMLVAPWSVYTTNLGGGYIVNQGTSMAAPQVAGVAALIWAKQPKLKVHEVRAILAESATDLGPKGWDEQTGFGLLKADRALAVKLPTDSFEPNNKSSEARRIPMDRQISATLLDGKSIDWYKIDSAYKGDLQLDLQSDNNTLKNFRVDLYDSNNKKYKSLSWANAKSTTLVASINKGTTALKVTYAKTSKAIIPYRLTAGFQIAADAYENNEDIDVASQLPVRSQTITGTFSKINDNDWYTLTFPANAEIELEATVDSNRIDLELLFEKEYEYPDLVDFTFEGESEQIDRRSVKAGDVYYLRVRNVSDIDDVYPVKGQYQLKIKIAEHYSDRYESNDTRSTATEIGANKAIEATFSRATDLDWYEINLPTASYINVNLNNLPQGVFAIATLVNSEGKAIQSKTLNTKVTKIAFDRPQAEGTYYIRLLPNKGFDSKRYKLKYTLEQVIAGYRDINEHPKQAAIRTLVKAKVLQPAANGYFYPNREITREEAAALVKATLNVEKQRIIGINDKNAKQTVSRAQAAEIICKMLGWEGEFGIVGPFDDVGFRYWAVRYIRQVKEENLMKAIKNDKFYPEKAITRADFADLMVKVLNRK